MKSYGGVLILFALFLFSFSNKSVTHNNSRSAHLNQGRKSSLTVIDNSFVSRVRAKDLVYSNITALYKTAKIDKEIVNNIHWPEIKDTISTIQLEQDTLRYYHAQKKIMLYYFNVASSKLVLDRNLKTGVSGDFLKAKFKLQSIPDTVIVQDIEAGFTFNLILNANKTKLEKITFRSYLD